jgi:sigma-B regulation protein RsbU (phosphoserine phosphatase)
MTFRTTLLLGILALLGGVLAALALTVTFVIERSARADVAAGIARAEVVVKDLHAQRQTLLDAEVRVLAEEPRLKAVTSTEAISRETVVGVVTDMATALSGELFVLTDGTGQLLVDANHPEATAGDLSQNPVVATAIAKGSASGIWIDGDTILQVQAQRLQFGATTSGVLVIGYRWDARIADVVQRESGSVLALLVDGKVVAAPTKVDDQPTNLPALSTAIQGESFAAKTADLTVGDVGYMASRSPVPGYEGSHKVAFVVLQSLDAALAPSRALKRVLYIVMFAGIVCAALVAAVFARRLSRPIDRLVAFTQEIGRGGAGKAQVEGPRELQILGGAMNKMADELAVSRAKAIDQERLTREMKIASRIQTGVLPKRPRIAHFDVGTRMVPATEVGGDFYDLVPTQNGCWIGVGDVSGHGLIAGLTMLMVQSMFAALCRESPDAKPSELLSVLNESLWENLRHRLERTDHMTLTLIRCEPDGRLVHAGAHEDILVLRKGEKECEVVTTLGPWVGARRQIRHIATDHEFKLEHGDLVVLHTDGITETKGPANEQFGLHRICRIVEEARDASVQTIADRVIEGVEKFAISRVQDDDRSVVVLRVDLT